MDHPEVWKVWNLPKHAKSDRLRRAGGLTPGHLGPVPGLRSGDWRSGERDGGRRQREQDTCLYALSDSLTRRPHCFCRRGVPNAPSSTPLLPTPLQPPEDLVAPGPAAASPPRRQAARTAPQPPRLVSGTACLDTSVLGCCGGPPGPPASACGIRSGGRSLCVRIIEGVVGDMHSRSASGQIVMALINQITIGTTSESSQCSHATLQPGQ